ncbi:MAG: ABC transporter [Thiothrix lacustris]|uniref:ABC transporter n=1 Tax=Thiothrix lacustris TaxID=525917 RepID=A0A1Y1QI71_9GAMM|nr:MAG: ABC transporter [Thiothrix lacustris]
MKMSKNAHRLVGLQNAIFYALFVVVIVLLGFLSRTFKFEADWTYASRNSLTAPTQTLLATLDKPLAFIAYIPDNPSLQEQVKQLVAKYQRIKPDTTLEFVNPDLDPARAKQDEIDHAGQLVIRYAGRSEVMDSASEETLGNAIQRLSRGSERLVVFLEGHGERQPLATQSNGMSQLVANLKRSGFLVQPHNLVRTQSIPQNASFAVIAAPQQDFLPGEVAVLKQYVEQGGNLLWLQDPGGLHGLQPLEELLGLQIFDGTAIDANEQLQALLGINHPAVVPVVDYGKSEIVQKLAGTQTVFPFATMIARAPDAGKQDGALVWEAEEFLNTLPTSWLESSGVLEGAVKFDEGSNDQEGPIPIGVSLTRMLAAATDKPDVKPREQRVVVIGDSDFMLNSFIGLGANLDLASNTFNWLSADDGLLEVPVMRSPDTKLELSETAGYLLGTFFLFLLPIGMLLAGGWIWWLRRRR